MNLESHEDPAPVQAPSPDSSSRLWILIRFAIVVGSLAFGARGLWLALKNEPMNSPPLAPFIAFGVAVILLTYNDMADQLERIFRKDLSRKRKSPGRSKLVILSEESPRAATGTAPVTEEAESEPTLRQLAEKYGFTEDDFHEWKARYGSSDESLLQQLLELKEENRMLKEMYANLSLEHQMLKERLNKKDR